MYRAAPTRSSLTHQSALTITATQSSISMNGTAATSAATPNLQQCIKQLANTPHSPSTPTQLDGNAVGGAISEIMSGEAPPALVSAFLTLLSPQRFTPEIIATAARSMRSHALPWTKTPMVFADQLSGSNGVLDIVGTGGDGLDTFNVSTCASFIVAACGQPVVKHGNRSSSSKCGSADLIEALGANITDTIVNNTPASSAQNVEPLQHAAQIVQQCGFVFLFAQRCHPSMRHVGPLRKQLGIKTIFNVLGPLTNPCIPSYQLTGVYSPELGQLFAEALQRLGVKSAMVVHSADGMDEISCADVTTHVWHLQADGSIKEYDVHPTRDFGLPTHSLSEVASGSATDNAATLHEVLSGKQRAETDHVLLNAAAALVVCGKAKTFKEGVELCRQAISSGAALKVVEQYVQLTQQVATESTTQQSASSTNGAAPTDKKQSILQKIAEHRRQLVATAKQSIPLEELCYSIIRDAHNTQLLPPRIDILQRLHAARQMSPGHMCMLAEIKRASPSAGPINMNIDPVQQALEYAKGGAAAISVLCEPNWFRGSLADLRAIRAALASVPNRPALLLKDFVEDEYQLVEGRAAGADTALLIVASLERNRLERYISVSRALGMEPLVEVANEQEMQIALEVGAILIGVNNRNLHTFTVDQQTTNRLATAFHSYHAASFSLPPARRPLLLALSGIKTRKDVEVYEQAGAGGVLVGEQLMKSGDAGTEIRSLLGITQAPATDAASTPASAPTVPSTPFVKICGIRRPTDALQAASAGADLLGLIFVEKSKRYVTVQQAQAVAHAIHNINGPTEKAAQGSTNVNQLPHIAQQHTNGVAATSNGSKQSSHLSQYFTGKATELAALITRARLTGDRPLLVGVFQNKSAEEINSIAAAVPLDVVQLHGDEGWEVAKQIQLPVIRSVSVDPATATVDSIVSELKPDLAAAVLLDTKSAAGGGSGQTFDWKIAAAITQQHHIPVFLAGGLEPTNVRQAVQLVQPLAVDVASGVEHTDSSGVLQKNHTKVQQFIASAKSAAPRLQ